MTIVIHLPHPIGICVHTTSMTCVSMQEVMFISSVHIGRAVFLASLWNAIGLRNKYLMDLTSLSVSLREI